MANSLNKTNLLLIMTDQQRFDTIASAGNPYIHTPSLDRLCSTGVRFHRAYTESPVCTPARAILLTGQWGHRIGVMDNGTSLKESTPTFVQRLNEAGYVTQAIGTMGFDPARNRHGFSDLLLSEDLPSRFEDDDFLQYLRSVGYGYVDEPHGVRHAYYYVPQVSQLPDEFHVTTWVGDRTVEFIQRSTESKPWFLFASFIKPHPPFDPTIPYLTLYDPENLPLPVRRDKQDYNRSALKSQNYYQWMESVDDNMTRLIKSAYYASITQVDAQIGRILNQLEQTGLRENTLILFLSDHGEMLGDHYHWGKGCFHEGATRIPYILSWPGHLPEGEVRDVLVGHRDVAPTLLTAAGITDGVEQLPGMNLLPLAGNAHTRGREITFGEYSMGHRAQYMAVTAEWKYIYSPNGGQESLYHLSSDPYELYNRISDSDTGHHTNYLRNELIRFFMEEGYNVALSSGHNELMQLPYQEPHQSRGRQYALWTTSIDREQNDKNILRRTPK